MPARRRLPPRHRLHSRTRKRGAAPPQPEPLPALPPHDVERITEEALIERCSGLGAERRAEPCFRPAGSRTLGDDKERAMHGAAIYDEPRTGCPLGEPRTENVMRDA